jgi:hypothetical protein
MYKKNYNKKALAFLFILMLGFYATFGGVFFETGSRAGASQDLPASGNRAFEREDDAFDQKAALARLREQIKGREKEPAAEVFKNIQILKEMPAGRLLSVMEMGYSRSLGANCTHCHVPEKWELDAQPAKQTAREMIAMTSIINTQLLKAVKNLKNPNPTINCTTCHRGEIKPALNLPAARQQP